MYLIIGATGYLGSYFLANILRQTNDQIFATKNSSNAIFFDNRIKWQDLNLSSFDSIDNLYAQVSAQNNRIKVIFLSSYHNPDLVEKNKKLAWEINVASLDYFLNKFCDIIDSFYYASSDTVYGESVNNYAFKEEDRCFPVNTYGRTKLMAEALVLSYGFNIVRYPFLIGPSQSHKKHFYDFIYDKLKSDQLIEMFGDSYRSPLDFNVASIYTIDLIERFPEINHEIINICSDTPLSKYDIAVLIAQQYCFNKANIVKISIRNSPIFCAKRATNTIMNNSKVKKILNLKNIKLTI